MQLSIDDFGIGYSSMAYLKSLPVQDTSAADRQLQGRFGRSFKANPRAWRVWGGRPGP